MAADIEGTWDRIHRALARECPSQLATFRLPASPADVGRLEERLGVRLPDEFRRSLAVHDGQDDPLRLSGLTLDGILLGVGGIIAVWEGLCEIDRQMAESEPDWGAVEWWNPRWVPLTDGTGDHLCINLDPALCPEGQLVYFVHDNPFDPDGPPGFGAWLETIAARLEAGLVERRSAGGATGPVGLRAGGPRCPTRRCVGRGRHGVGTG